MKVKLRTTYASPKLTAVSGSTVDLPEKEAVALVGGGYAEYCKESKVEVEAKKPAKDNKAKAETESKDAKNNEPAKDNKAGESKKDK